MIRFVISALIGVAATGLQAQQASTEPFPTPIETVRDVIGVNFIEFASIPNDDAGFAPRLMLMVTEPGSERLFISSMLGSLYSMNYDGSDVTPYIDINAANWGVQVMSAGSERGLQSFAFHPQFAEEGAPGYGKFYTYTDSSNTAPTPDYVTDGERRTHDTVLLEWTTNDASAATYDGGAPKVLFRAAQPFANHNGGQIAFNPLAKAGAEDFGLLYVGLADGGSGGDPFHAGQNLSKYFGKILRLDPLGSNGPNGQYGIPASNPFVADGDDDTLGEIYAYGVRNPQRFSWDTKDGTLLLAEIGQNMVEEISPITKGGNLGWNIWEGSYRYVDRQINLENPRSDANMIWPIVEYDHVDPLFQRTVAITGLAVYREPAIQQLQNKLVFGDNPSGEIFYIDADAQNNGGQSSIRRILLNNDGEQKNLLQIIQEKNAELGQDVAQRADLRFGYGPSGQIFLLNKHDGIIRLLVSGSAN